jgi:putative oxidoreductase
MKNLLLSTEKNWTGLILRLSIGLILWPHGAQKMLGLFGGFGFSATMDFLISAVHLPWIIAFMVIIIEFIGSLCILAGFASRLWSFAIIILMLGIIFSTHIDNGFFMNWFGKQKGEGFEFHLLMIGLSLALLINGSGIFSADALLMQKRSK